jgi:hypothetical protein
MSPSQNCDVCWCTLRRREFSLVGTRSQTRGIRMFLPHSPIPDWRQLQIAFALRRGCEVKGAFLCHEDVSLARVFQEHFKHLLSAEHGFIPPRLSFRFLSSPTEIVPDPAGHATALVVSENDLVLNDNGSASARPTGKFETISVDSVIFAIGDLHDPGIGLPVGPQGYATRPILNSGSGPSYEVWDPGQKCVVPGQYVVGLGRKGEHGTGRHRAS